MKRWTVLILLVLAVFSLTAAACAEPEGEYFILELRDEQQQRQPNFLLWQSDYFVIHTNIARNTDVLFYYDTDAEPYPVRVDENGYGEAWFTAGTTDVYPYAFDALYNENNLVQHYAAHLELVDENGGLIAESSEVEYTAGLTSAETPVFAPTVTGVTTGAIRRDGVFSATVSNEAGFQTMYVALFDDRGDCIVDSHWIDVAQDAAPTVIDTPLLRLDVNAHYTAKIYGLIPGRPLACAPETYDILVLSPDSQAEGTDILMMGLRDEYATGELILPVLYYPNSEGLQDIEMEIAVFASRYENTPWRWDSDLFLGPDETGGIYYQPEVWNEPICSWQSGEHVFRVTVWLNDGDERIPLDSLTCTFSVASGGPIAYDPGLPVSVGADSLPCTFTVQKPDADGYRVYVLVYDREVSSDYTQDWYDETDEGPIEVTIASPSQRVYIVIQAQKAGYDLYEREFLIPVVTGNSRISLWTDPALTDPLPLYAEVPLWVSAPGADWIEVSNIDDCFFREDDPDRINSEGPFEIGDSIRSVGTNIVIAVAQFTDGEGNSAIEAVSLVLEGYAEGEAGPFAAFIDRDDVSRGDMVTVEYTRSENANHYWVDVETWNEGRGRWDFRDHLADLHLWDENQERVAVLSTATLEPGVYRLHAMAEGEGYFTAETVITEEYTVRDALIPDSGILIRLTDDSVETGENIRVSAYAPGAEWMEIYWDRGNDSHNTDFGDGDSASWDHAYDLSGEYEVAVKAGRDVLDENGDPVWEHDEDGNSWKIQEEWWSDPITVCVSATNGYLDLTVPDGIPATLSPSEDCNLTFTVAKPQEAEALAVSVWIDEVPGDLFWNVTYEEEMPVSVHAPLESGQIVRVSLHAQAVGYESADIDLRIPVAADASDLVRLTVGEANYPQEDGKYLVPMGGDIRFLVSAAPGHSLTEARLYAPNGWQTDGYDSFYAHYGNESDIGRDVPVFALARIDDSEQWVQSNLIWARQMDYQIGAFHFTSETIQTVERGLDAVFTFTPAKGADDYWVDAWDACGDNNSCNPHTYWNGTAVCLNTAQLPEGEYIIRGRAGADGKGWRESDDSVRLIVTPGGLPQGAVRLVMDKTAALTGEEISASVYAPGADWVEIIRRHMDNGREDDFAHSDGEGAFNTFSEGSARTVEVFARAHYFERDENGDTVPDQDENGNDCLRELPYQESETRIVTFTAPNGTISLNADGVPVSAVAGADLPLYVPMPDDADSMNWELRLNWDADNDGQRPDCSGRGALDMTIPGSEILPDTLINLQVWASGIGYEGDQIDLALRVLEASENRITLTVSKPEVAVNEAFSVTVTAEGAESIQYFNGNGFRTEWDENLGEEVNQNLPLDENGQWSISDQDYGDAGVKALYAQAFIDGEWVASDPVKVVVTRDGKVGAFSIDLDQASVTRGDVVTLNYTVADHSVESDYELHHGRFQEDEAHYGLDWRRNEADHLIAFSTADMPAGDYWLRVRAQGEQGYEGRESNQVLLTVTDPATDAIGFTLPQTRVQTSVDVPVGVYAPGAWRIEIHWRENDAQIFDSESYSGYYSFGEAGVYHAFVRAWYPDRDEPVDSDTVTITVTSNGQKIPLDLSALPAGFVAGQDALITVPRPEGAGYMDWEISFDNDDPFTDNRSGEYDSLNCLIPGSELHEGSTVHLRVWTGAPGYENNQQDRHIPVVGAADAGITLEVSDSAVLVSTDFTVTVTAPGAAYIQYYNGSEFWSEWDDSIQDNVITNLDLDENGQWIYPNENFGCADTYSLYARGWIPDAENENGGYWISSEPVAVTVIRNGFVGDFTVGLNAASVTRGDLVALNYTVADRSVENRYDLHHNRDRSGDGEESIDYRLDWRRDEDAHQIIFSTADMPAGEYWLSVWAPGAPGYEGRESAFVRLTVAEAPENAISFELSASSVQTAEDIQASVYAPGASRGELHWQDNDVWDFDGETWSGQYNYGDAGVYHAFVRVWYPDQQEPADSDWITVTVSSNGEKLPFDFSLLPARIIAGEDTLLTVPRPYGAVYMDWEIHLSGSPDPYANNHQRDYDFLNLEIPGSELQEGDMILLRIWAGALGCDNNYQELRIPVVGQANDEINFAVTSASVETCEDITCTASFAPGVYSRIQFFDGEQYTDEELLDADETSHSFETGFGINGTYTVYARLQRASDGEWIYTPDRTVEATAPLGPLTLDVSAIPARVYAYSDIAIVDESAIPARVYEVTDVSFTLGAVTDSDGNTVSVLPNYQLYYRDETGEKTELIRWNDAPKTGTVTISAENIVAGRVFVLDYSVFARGYEPVLGGTEIHACAEPTVMLSVDKKTVFYGEEVTFTVIAPDAASTNVVWWQNDAPGSALGGTAWEADELGTLQFSATATYDGFGTVTARPVSVTVRSLGEAPAPYVEVPEVGDEGAQFQVVVYPELGEWVSVWIYDSAGEKVRSEEHRYSYLDLSVNDALAGTYLVRIEYGQDGYDDGQMELSIPVEYWYCSGPEWTWEDDFSAATAVFTSMRGDSEVPIEAEISSEITAMPTCGMTGIRTYTAEITFNGQKHQDTKTETLAPTEHDWGAPVFTWTEAEGKYTAAATFTCANDSAHTREDAAEVTLVHYSAATCAEQEITVYRAACAGFTEDKTVEGEPALGHDWSWRVVWNDDCTAYATRKCGRCGTSENAEVEVVPTVTREATCQVKEEITYSVDVTLDGQHLKSSKKQYTARAPHTPDEPVFSEDGHFTCTYCAVCGELLSAEFYGHNWSAPVYVWADDCRSVTATRACSLTPAHSESETVPATARETKAATCEENGETTYTSAAFANPAFTVQTKTVADIQPLGHAWGEPAYEWAKDSSAVTAARICAHNAEHVDTETANAAVTVRQSPTNTAPGVKLYTAAFNNPAFASQEKQGEIPALSAMTTLRLPSALKTIEREAFANLTCQAIIIPDGCETIEAYAFAGCSGLLYIRIPASVASWPETAFDGYSPTLAIDHPTAN